MTNNLIKDKAELTYRIKKFIKTAPKTYHQKLTFTKKNIKQRKGTNLCQYRFDGAKFNCRISF